MKPLIQVKHLSKHYPIKGGHLKAIDSISFEIFPGETLGLVGESGCGKSTTGRCILNLEPPTSGEIHFDGMNLGTCSPSDLRQFRKEAQVNFQDPYASLNPRMNAFDIISEPLLIHKTASQAQARPIVAKLLDLVGLSQTSLQRYPHEFSGGQRQRIGIARALALNPKFIVCDEPISALDVSVQAQIVNLLKQLQQEMGLTYLFIAHDLAMVKYISDRVAVMYLGHLVEIAPAEELYSKPLHPYTQALLAAIPIPDPTIEHKRPRALLQGELPSPLKMAGGCPFASRCPHAMPICREQTPALQEIAPGHQAACHLLEVVY
jgi:oligopeptide/dipeptide ABC transporter ATP-binding protein